MKKKKGYYLLYALTILLTLAAISTIIPQESVRKACMLGYKAHCSFTPIGTLICGILVAVVCRIRKRKFTE